jgi:hypothetical protein
MSHWLTRFDPDDGEPYGTVCFCPIGRDHTQAEWQEFLDDVREWADNPDDESDQEFVERTRELPDA